MTNYAAYHNRTTRQGQFNHHALQPGETFVDDGDMQRWVYKIPRGSRRGFRKWVEFAFEGDRPIVVSGNYRDGYRINEKRSA